MSNRQPQTIQGRIASVIDNDQCSGCGACTALVPGLKMTLNQEGFLRPDFSSAESTEADQRRDDLCSFEQICPGLVVANPPALEKSDPYFGRYVSAWIGWAADEEIRTAGSSGGVITALSTWLVETSRAESVSGVAASPKSPSRAVPVRILSREDAIKAAGSRYQPVAGCGPYMSDGALIAKPCEAAAIQAYRKRNGSCASAGPVISFFCAGTPSQLATEKLVSTYAISTDEVVSLRYRGDGWPGNFRVVDSSGRVGEMSYHESWGQVLGREVQYRCKLCVDGTGESADIAVGDYWYSDSSGDPIFNDAPGRSVVIARTEYGASLVREAISEGLIIATPIEDLSTLHSIQQHQVHRRKTLYARLAGRRLAGIKVPSYPGSGIWRFAVRYPVASLRAFAGSYLRSRRRR